MVQSSALTLFSRSPSVVSIVLYVAMFVVYAAVQGEFALSVAGISTLLNNSISLAIGATALTFVVLTGGFDLSLAGIVALTNTLLSVIALNGVFGAVEGFVVACVVGAAIGVVNGLLIAYYKLQSIAVTLGTMIMASGVALFMLEAPGGNVPDSHSLRSNWINWSYSCRDHHPRRVHRRDVAAVELHQIRHFDFRDRAGSRRSPKFRHQCRMDGVSRLRPGRCGVRFAGYMVSAEIGTGDPRFDPSFLLLAFAAVAIGGTSFRGGTGTVLGSVVGAGFCS